MKKAQSLRHSLCQPFCAYWKPGNNKDLACRGYQVVAGFVQAGRSLPFAPAGRDFDHTRAEVLVNTMCRVCDFQEDGCDFMRDRTVPPCGGFVLLARLLQQGVITIDDI